MRIFLYSIRQKGRYLFVSVAVLHRSEFLENIWLLIFVCYLTGNFSLFIVYYYGIEANSGNPKCSRFTGVNVFCWNMHLRK